MNMGLTNAQREAIAHVARPGPLTIYQLDDICRAIACLEVNPECGTPTLSRVERARIEAEISAVPVAVRHEQSAKAVVHTATTPDADRTPGCEALR